MQKKFLSGLFLILLLNLLVKPFFIFAIDAEVQNRVGEEVYGNYFALLNFSLLFNILLDMGISNYTVRQVAREPGWMISQYFKILALRCAFFVLYATVTLISGYASGYSGQEFVILAILGLNQFFVAVIQFSRANLSGLHLFKTDAVISVLDRFLLIIFCAGLLWTDFVGDVLRIEWFVFAQTLAYLITALVSVILLALKRRGVKPHLKKDFSWKLLRESFPYALLILLMMLYTRADAILLERLLPDGDEQAGIYAQGYRYLDAVNMFALLFAGMLLPVFSRQIKENGPVQSFVHLGVRLLISAAIVVSLAGFFFRNELLAIVYDHTSAFSGQAFGFVILSFLPVSITYIYGTLLTANGNLGQLNLMAAAMLVLNVGLNLVLIPRFKAEGAAMTTFITQWAAALIQVIIVQRVFRFKMDAKILTALVILPLVLAGAFFLFDYLQFEFRLALPLFLAIGGVLILLLRLFRKSDLVEMFGKE
jgi:O-antigen/teichoic acid export membrane protein